MYKLVIVLALIGATANAQMSAKGIGADSLYLIGSNGNSVELRPGSVSSSFSLTLPTDAGTNGQVLQTDGAGALTWITPASASAPAGVIITFAGATCPSGYLAADGSAVSRTTYATLYTALGQTSSPWGQGDGSTTFNLPDLRNRFLRGTGTNNDSNGGVGVNLGVYQGDAFQGHYHNFQYGTRFDGNGGFGPSFYGTPMGAYSDGNVPTKNTASNMAVDAINGAHGTISQSTETRPKSYGVLMCVKS